MPVQSNNEVPALEVSLIPEEEAEVLRVQLFEFTAWDSFQLIVSNLIALQALHIVSQGKKQAPDLTFAPVTQGHFQLFPVFACAAPERKDFIHGETFTFPLNAAQEPPDIRLIQRFIDFHGVFLNHLVGWMCQFLPELPVVCHNKQAFAVLVETPHAKEFQRFHFRGKEVEYGPPPVRITVGAQEAFGLVHGKDNLRRGLLRQLQAVDLDIVLSRLTGVPEPGSFPIYKDPPFLDPRFGFPTRGKSPVGNHLLNAFCFPRRHFAGFFFRLMLVKSHRPHNTKDRINVRSVNLAMHTMNFIKHHLLKSFLPLVLAPVLVNAQPTVKVVYEDPDGATLLGANVVNVTTGMELEAGDTINTGDATVILSLCGGSLVTIYPNSEVTVTSASGMGASLSLSRGELLGDASASCDLSVSTVAGTASISDGVFGVLMNRMGGQGWTLQVRNLDGGVNFIGDPNLDVSNVTVSVIEPNMEMLIPTGEEIIVRGIYNEEARSFALTQDGVLAMMDEDVVGEMRDEAQTMASSGIETDTPQVQTNIPVIIEIPFEDVETASDKG